MVESLLYLVVYNMHTYLTPSIQKPAKVRSLRVIERHSGLYLDEL